MQHISRLYMQVRTCTAAKVELSGNMREEGHDLDTWHLARRTSNARLLTYSLDEGCSARQSPTQLMIGQQALLNVVGGRPR